MRKRVSNDPGRDAAATLAGFNRREVLQGALFGMTSLGFAHATGPAQAQTGTGLGRVWLHNPGRRALRPAPVTFGLSLPRGILGRQSSVVLRVGSARYPAQLDSFNAWDDGSLRFGIVSSLGPELGPGQEVEALIEAAAGPPLAGSGIGARTLADYLATNGGTPELVWHDRDSGTYMADAAVALAGRAGWEANGPALAGRWLDGPVCTEWVCSTPLVNERRQVHPSLRAFFHCRAWHQDGRIVGARVDAVLDNTVGPFEADVREAVGDLHLRQNGTTVWSRAGGDLSAMGVVVADAGKQPGQFMVRTQAAAFRPDHRFMTLDVDGVVLHLLEIGSDREAMARPLADERCVAANAVAKGAGAIPVNGTGAYRGAAYLHQSRRLRVAAASKQSLSGRRFRVAGIDSAGGAIEELLAVGGGNEAVGRQRFAVVTAVSCDGPTGGGVDIGNPPPTVGPAGSARLWGVSLPAWTRWPVRLAYGQAGAEPMVDPAMFVRSRLLPNYAPELMAKGHEAWVGGLVRSIAGQTDSSGRLMPGSRDPDYSHGRCLNVIMGGAQPGGRPDLAIVPGQQVAWVFAPRNRAMYGAMLACGYAMHQWPCHWRERATGLPVDPGQRKSFTTHFNASENDKPPHWRRGNNTIARIATDPEHWIEFSYLPFLATGDLHHYESLFDTTFAAWAWHPARWPYLTAHEGYERAIVTTNARSIAWVMRNLGHFRICAPERLPDRTVAAPAETIERIYQTQQAWLKQWYAIGPDPNGLMPADKGEHKFLVHGKAPEYAYAQWMHSYLSASMAHLSESGSLGPDGQSFFNWYKTYSVDQADPAQTYPAAAASSYYWRARRPDGTPIRSMRELYQYMAENEWLEPGSNLFTQLEPNTDLVIEGNATTPGARVVLRAYFVGNQKARPTFSAALQGRQVFTPQDGGRGRIEKVVGVENQYGTGIEVRVERPFRSDRYKPKQWRLQLPLAGQAPQLMLDPTRSASDYTFLLIGALGVLASARVDGAREAWKRLRESGLQSAADFTLARADLCGWAIAPRQQG